MKVGLQYMDLAFLWWNKVHSIDGHFRDPKSALDFNLWGQQVGDHYQDYGLLGTFQTTQGNALARRPCLGPVSCMT